jgi:dipicolinate synthase subunit B
MQNDKKQIGFALCGSFCTMGTAVATLLEMTKQYDVIPIMSETAYSNDTRFGRAQDFINTIVDATGKEVIHTVTGAEPIGPKKLLDCLVIAPCTGNTLAKLAEGITDSAVTMAAKAHLRNDRPLVLAISTNDALSGSAKNIGALLGRRDVYFVPFSQDDPMLKPRSCIADFSLIEKTVAEALEGRQLQPIFK